MPSFTLPALPRMHKRPIPRSPEKPQEFSELGKEMAAGGMAAPVISRDLVKLGKELGSGGFGKVHLAEVQGWVEPVVSKVMKPRKMEPKEVKLLKLEMTIWSTIEHPHCLRLLGVALEPTEFCLLSELCDGGSMGDAIARVRANNRPKPSASELRQLMRQMASGMAHLHAHGVMHRDLKSPNILLERKGDTLLQSCPLKICDFGLARHLPVEDRAAALTAETGSYRWMAPEVIRHEPYNSSCDVYSFAVVCSEIITYQLPFSQESAVQAAFAVATKNRRPEVAPSGDSDVDALIQECWHHDCGARPAFVEVVARLARQGSPDPVAESAAALSSQFSPIFSASSVCSSSSSSAAASHSRADEAVDEQPLAVKIKRPASISTGLFDLEVSGQRSSKSPRASPSASPSTSPVVSPESSQHAFSKEINREELRVSLGASTSTSTTLTKLKVAL